MKVARLKEILDQYEARYPGVEVFWQLPANTEEASLQPSIMLGIAYIDREDGTEEPAPFMIFRPLVDARYVKKMPGISGMDINRQDVYGGQDPSDYRGKL